jgi:hypothetical protein
MRTWTLPFEKPPAWLEKGSFAFEVKPVNNKSGGRKEVCEKKGLKNSEKSKKRTKSKTQNFFCKKVNSPSIESDCILFVIKNRRGSRLDLAFF